MKTPQKRILATGRGMRCFACDGLSVVRGEGSMWPKCCICGGTGRVRILSPGSRKK